MADINESERFAILRQASETLERDFRQMQAEKNVVISQIAEHRKTLADVLATIDAAKIMKEKSLEALAAEQAQAEAAFLKRSETLRIEVMQLESVKSIREKELQATVEELSSSVEAKREHLSRLTQSVREQEAKLVEIRAAVNALRSTLNGVIV